MALRFLFRLDMSKDNEEFLALRRSGGVDHVYAGSPMRVGPGWIPDFVEVAIEEAKAPRITLIELEATDIPARASCRKYLPEKSSELFKVFLSYLDGVISQCQSTADPRLDPFLQLKNVLVGSANASLHTAAGLRNSADFLEEYPLIDQPERSAPRIMHASSKTPTFTFAGEARLSRENCEGLLRTLRILHAVIAGSDHSGGLFRSWRNMRRKALDGTIARFHAQYPQLEKLLKSKTDSGLRVDCDAISSELVRLWSDLNGEAIDIARVRKLVSEFVPIALEFKEHDRMQDVFDRARELLRTSAD